MGHASTTPALRRSAAVLGILLCGCGDAAGTPPDAALPDAALPDAALPDAVVVADASVPAPWDADDLFAAENLPEIELTLSASSLQGLAEAPFVYQRGTVRVGDVVVEDVGVRLKGAASFRPIDGKPAFKVKMNEFVKGQRLFGLRRLTLNNLVQDPSAVHERLGYRFMRAAGVAAPRCNSARVVVNGEYWGLYANVETLDEEFVQSRFGDEVGNLYDLSSYFVDLLPGNAPGFVLETNDEVADRSDVEALIAAATRPAGTFVADVEPLLDLDALLRLGATQAIIADWDGYFGARNNYKLYHDVASDRFVMLPWGIDQILGSSSDPTHPRGDVYDLYGSQSDRYNGWLFLRCKAEPDCRARYQAAVADALDVWRSLPLEAELDAMVEQILQSVIEDPRRVGSVSLFNLKVERVRLFLQGRAAKVQAQLDGPLPELCENDEDDDGDGLVDCLDPDCAPQELGRIQNLCLGQDDSCAGAPLPDTAPDPIQISGYMADFAVEVLPGVLVEVVTTPDGTLLASTTSDETGWYSFAFSTGGLPADVVIRQSLPGRLTNTLHLGPLTADVARYFDVLFRPEDLDALADAVGIQRDPMASILAVEAVDCADIRIFNPMVVLTPAPPELEVVLFQGLATVLNVPPGEYEASATFELRSLGPAQLRGQAGEIAVTQLRP